jgi:hypothetical protein
MCVFVHDHYIAQRHRDARTEARDQARREVAQVGCTAYTACHTVSYCFTASCAIANLIALIAAAI